MMASQDDEAILEKLLSQWKGVSDQSARHSTYANLLLARLLGTIRAKTNWSAEKLQETLVKLAVESGLSFSLLVECLGEKNSNQIAVDLAGIPKGTISRLLTVDSKVSLGSFRAGEQLSNCYEQILEIPIDRFPTSTIELTSSLDEAVLSSSSSPNPSASEYGFATRVARSFDAAAIKRETTRKEAAKNKAEKLALARERRRQEKDEIRRHKLALRAEATREKEIRATRQIELCRLRSEVYKAGVTRAEAERNHQRSIAEAVADGQREARLEVAWNSGRETEMLRREASENEGPKGFRRVGSAKPNRELIDKSAHRRCAKSAKRLRDERTRMVTKACDALRVAKQNIHNAMDVPYPDEGTQRKVLKSRELVHEALSELHGLVADGQSNTVT